MQDDKAHLWRWDLLECGVKSGVPELSQSDLWLWFRIWGHRSLAG